MDSCIARRMNRKSRLNQDLIKTMETVNVDNMITTILIAMIVGIIAFAQGYMACKKEWDQEKLTRRD